MALPRQVRIGIEYDGTAKQLVTETTTKTVTDGDTEYTVAPGDCLWSIAKRFLGEGIKYTELYAYNKETMDAAARAHGFPDAQGGNYIWVGEVIRIPGQTTTETTTETRFESIGESNPILGHKMRAALTSYSYTDVASGQSDSIQMTMHDIAKEWMGSLMPKKGADISTQIIVENWEGVNSFECGTFIIDDISFSGTPTQCTIGAVSVPANEDFKSNPVTSTWDKSTLKEIASKVAEKAGIELVYEADTIQIEEIEQSEQTDSAFLMSLCDKYGVAMKIYNYKIVLFDFVKYEEANPVATIREHDIIRWSYNTTLAGTYTGVNLNYTDPENDEPIKVTIGEEGRMYTMNTQASGKFDAELQAAAKVNQANRSAETMNITIKPISNIVASQTVNIEGFGNIDGKYFIDQIKHSAGNGGYTMQLTLHKVQKPIKMTEPVAASIESSVTTYTIVAGDTLWGIAKNFYGNGMKYTDIYNANAETLDQVARDHGYANANGGNYIWAGTVITIP